MPVKFNEKRKRWIVDETNTYGGRTRKSFLTEKKAREYLVTLRASNEKQLSGRKTLAETVRLYFENVSVKKFSGKIEKRTLNLLCIFCDERGIRFIDEVRHHHLESFQTWLREKRKFGVEGFGDLNGLSNSSVNRYFACYRHLFKYCYNNDFIKKDPARYLEKLNEAEVDRKVITDAEFLQVKEISPDWFKPVLDFLHLTGLRPSSLERMKWGDVHFDSLMVIYTTRKGYKGGTREKVLPMIKPIEQVLLGLSRGGDGDAVFLNEFSRPLKADRISRVGNRLIRQAGIEGVELYSLRHKLATDLSRSGVPLEKIKEVMGHSAAKMSRKYVQDLAIAEMMPLLNKARGSEKVIAFRHNLAQKGGASLIL